MNELVELIKGHDFWYMMSDDSNVYNKGAEESLKIRRGLKDFPKQEVLDNLPEVYHKFIDPFYV